MIIMDTTPEINLEKIKKLAVVFESENLDFRTYLKNYAHSKQIDIMVQRLNGIYSNAIDCTQCGNCCKELQPSLAENDIAFMASVKNCTVQQFENEHTQYDELDKYRFMKSQPCLFLKEKKCSIYENRPASCDEYPHLNKPDFKYRLKSVLANYELCPIVYNVVEALKKETHFKK